MPNIIYCVLFALLRKLRTGVFSWSPFRPHASSACDSEDQYGLATPLPLPLFAIAARELSCFDLVVAVCIAAPRLSAAALVEAELPTLNLSRRGPPLSVCAVAGVEATRRPVRLRT